MENATVPDSSTEDDRDIGNGEFDDEEEALQYAIQLSLEQELGSGGKPESVDDTEWLSLISAMKTSLQTQPLKPEFTYDPLPNRGDFRLMRLYTQSKIGHGIEFDLITVNFISWTVPYVTLSYSWGVTYPDGSHLTHVVSCNGETLRITGALYQALDRICETERRLGHEIIMLWVDGVCINQADVEERQRQVQQMPKIYASCSRLIIWLGEHSINALQWIERLGQVVLLPMTSGSVDLEGGFYTSLSLRRNALTREEILAELLNLLRTVCVEIPNPKEREAQIGQLYIRVSRGDLVLDGQPRLVAPFGSVTATQAYDDGERALVKGDAVGDGYRALLSRPWFRRKWVIQEIAQTQSARRVFLIADKVIKYEDLVENLRSHTLLDFASPLRAEAHQATLLHNLARYRHTFTSEPHDHIYALVGLSSDCFELTVDYTLGADWLYIIVAERSISKGNVVPVLCLATAKKSTGKLPSWVPDWNREADYDRCAMHRDALNTLTLYSQRLFEANNRHAGGVKIHSGVAHRLDLKAWIIPRCLDEDSHISNGCIKCKLINPEAAAPPPESKRWSNSLTKGKLKMTAPMQSSDHEALRYMRRNKAQLKWGGRIREQFEEVMHPEEVFCLLRSSPFGFVLKPRGDNCESKSLKTFTLEYCLQVDEEGWASDWFVSVLGEESQEWISLV